MAVPLQWIKCSYYVLVFCHLLGPASTSCVIHRVLHGRIGQNFAVDLMPAALSRASAGCKTSPRYAGRADALNHNVRNWRSDAAIAKRKTLRAVHGFLRRLVEL